MINKRTKFTSIFLNNGFVLSIVLLNAMAIFIKMSGSNAVVWDIADLICTMIFLIEMMVKHHAYGLRGYWSNGWNRLDGVLVILSLPSLAALLWPSILESLALLKVLRLAKVMRFLKMIRFFPNFDRVMDGFRKAMRETYAVWVCFFIMILILGMINCALFSSASPEYFSTPLQSIYTVFQLCTIEGWYDIPNSVAAYYNHSTILFHIVRLLFCIQLLMGGIIGMSLINSIFVDAMVADNNNELIKKVDELQSKIDSLIEKRD